MDRAARARVGFSLLAIFALGVPLACGAGTTTSTPPPVPPTPPPTTNAAPAAPPAAQAGPLASGFTTDPNALATLLAQAAAAGSAWLGPAAREPEPSEAGLRATAAQYAPGLVPEGDVAKATLTEGSHVSFTANLEPSKCYAVVAYGSGLADLDINLLMPPFYNLLAGQDGMAGSAAVIGASPAFICPLIALPVPYKIDLFAKKGGGPIAAQVYSRPR
ncbi:MAG: hypothetical protein U0270_33675 [Labilithrix sp.]